MSPFGNVCVPVSNCPADAHSVSRDERDTRLLPVPSIYIVSVMPHILFYIVLLWGEDVFFRALSSLDERCCDFFFVKRA